MFQFVNFEQIKSRSKQTDRIQGLYHEISMLLHSKTVHGTPTSIRQPSLGQSGPLAIESAASTRNACFSTSEQHVAHKQLLNWQAHLNTDIEQEIKQGNFAEAWNSVNTAMSRLEIIDSKSNIVETFKFGVNIHVRSALRFDSLWNRGTSEHGKVIVAQIGEMGVHSQLLCLW